MKSASWAIADDGLIWAASVALNRVFLNHASGWNLQRSEIRSVTDLSRLWFILAVATLYVTA